MNKKCLIIAGHALVGSLALSPLATAQASVESNATGTTVARHSQMPAGDWSNGYSDGYNRARNYCSYRKPRGSRSYRNGFDEGYSEGYDDYC